MSVEQHNDRQLETRVETYGRDLGSALHRYLEAAHDPELTESRIRLGFVLSQAARSHLPEQNALAWTAMLEVGEHRAKAVEGKLNRVQRMAARHAPMI